MISFQHVNNVSFVVEKKKHCDLQLILNFFPYKDRGWCGSSRPAYGHGRVNV